jgi:hypothetical protein
MWWVAHTLGQQSATGGFPMLPPRFFGEYDKTGISCRLAERI